MVIMSYLALSLQHFSQCVCRILLSGIVKQIRRENASKHNKINHTLLGEMVKLRKYNWQSLIEANEIISFKDFEKLFKKL